MNKSLHCTADWNQNVFTFTAKGQRSHLVSFFILTWLLILIFTNQTKLCNGNHYEESRDISESSALSAFVPLTAAATGWVFTLKTFPATAPRSAAMTPLWNTEVDFHRAWASDPRAERPQRRRSSSLAAVHTLSALHTIKHSASHCFLM